VRAGALGDLLLLRRAIAGLKGAGHGVSLLAPAGPARALLGPGPAAVDHVLDWDDPSYLPLFADGDGDSRPPLAVARLQAFSACIAYTERRHFIAGLERLVPQVLAHPPAPVGVHAAEWFAQPARALGAEPPALPPDLEPTAAEDAEADAFLSGLLPPGFLAIHPGSGAPAKNWPSERFAELAAELGPEPFLLVDGPADAAAAAGLAAGAAPVVRAHRLSLRTLGAVLRRAGLFVGNDSGVTHLAAAWGTPTLALFGPTDPTTWSPVGRRVAVVRSPSASMSDLSRAEVVRAARALR
jgi:ADP-heptose:LPS heptosyltransferase